MKAFAITAYFILFTTLSYGQNNLVTWQETKPLKWDDFSGKVNDTSFYEAECFSEIKYTYNFKSLDDFQFDVQAFFNPNTSWIKWVQE